MLRYCSLFLIFFPTNRGAYPTVYCLMFCGLCVCVLFIFHHFKMLKKYLIFSICDFWRKERAIVASVTFLYHLLCMLGTSRDHNRHTEFQDVSEMLSILTVQSFQLLRYVLQQGSQNSTGQKKQHQTFQQRYAPVLKEMVVNPLKASSPLRPSRRMTKGLVRKGGGLCTGLSNRTL